MSKPHSATPIADTQFTGHRFRAMFFYTLPLLLAVAFYGYAVDLPFFLDDGPHFNILVQTDGLQHWGDFPPFPFYRPFTFTLWKLFEPFGYLAAHMHLLNVLCFGAAGVMAGQVARLLLPARYRLAGATFTGCAVVAFPFSYQAIVMVAALFHLTLTLGMLVCLWAGLKSLSDEGRQPALLALCWIGAFVGVFSHENGVLLVPLLAAVIALRGGLRRPRRAALITLPVFGMVGLYVLLWATFSPAGSLTLTEDVFASFGVLLQGTVYPLAAALSTQINGDIDAPLLVAFVVAVLLIVPGVIYMIDQRAGRVSAYGALWIVLAITPAAILLPAGYTLGQPRLALLASVGMSLLWGTAFASLWVRNGVIYRGVGVLMVLAFAGVSVGFLSERRADFERLAAWNDRALTLFTEGGVAETGALLINAPGFTTPVDENRWFLLGTEGALYVDASLDYNQQFWMNSDTDYDSIITMAVPSLQRSSGFNYQAHPPVVEGDPLRVWAERAAHIYITQFDGLDFYPVLAGGTAVQLDEGAGPVADLGEGAYVLHDVAATYEADWRLVEVRARWEAVEPAAVKVFAHVYCDDEFLAQSDGYPWGDMVPFAAWEPGDVRVDVRSIRVDEGIDPACLRVELGLYTEADVARLAAIDTQSGDRYANDVVPVPVD